MLPVPLVLHLHPMHLPTSLPAKTWQKGPSTGLLHSPSLQATCVPAPNPAAHMYEYTKHQYARTYKDQLTRFPTMSSTILSWRKDTDEHMKLKSMQKGLRLRNSGEHHVRISSPNTWLCGSFYQMETALTLNFKKVLQGD